MKHIIRRAWETLRTVFRRHGAPGSVEESSDTEHGDAAPESSPAVESRHDADQALADLSPAEFLVRTGITQSEYVLYLLRQNDGQLPQRDICERLGWSKATTSRKLGALEDDERITRRRIGRGNVVLLADPEAAPSTSSSEASEPTQSGVDSPPRAGVVADPDHRPTSGG